MTNIIGLVGFKQVGKSTAAQYLEDQHGYVRHNFKTALVAEIKKNFPDLLWEIMNVYDQYDVGYTLDTIDDLFTTKPPVMRALLQNYGTEVRRTENPDYWVEKWWDAVMKHPKGNIFSGLQPAHNIVVDDCRFLNEAKAVKDAGGIIIHLTRPDLLTGGEHVSETEQLQIVADYTIECEAGDFEHLYRELDRVVENITKSN